MKSSPPISEEELKAAIAAAGSPEKAAPVLGKSRRTVYRWMEHYGIRRQPVYETEAA